MAEGAASSPRAVVWEGLGENRLELAVIEFAPTALRASVTQIGTTPMPYRLSYEVVTESDFSTRRLDAVSEGAGWRRRLELVRRPDRVWSSAVEWEGRPDLPPMDGLPDLSDAMDCDVGRSPLTNTLPVLRLGLLEGGEADLTMAWVSVPDLRVHRAEQSYEFVSAGSDGVTIRYVGRHRNFTAELEFDRDGIVIAYPGLARRLSDTAPRRRR